MAIDSTTQTEVPPAVLGEAADWLMRVQSGIFLDQERRDFERWRSQSPAHAAAWQRAEKVLSSFGQIPPQLARHTLERLGKPGRRQALQALGLLLIATPVAWVGWRELPWREWSADARTATGEQKTITLADGTRLVLNTASAVDIVFTANERRIRLQAGEILITTGRDLAPTPRPFVVETPQGIVRALGTRFSVRRLNTEHTQVAVFEHAVDVQPLRAPAQLLQAGQQTVFNAHGVQPPPSRWPLPSGNTACWSPRICG